MNHLRSETWTEFSLLDGDDLRALSRSGYLVLEDILSEAECDLWSGTVDEIWQKERSRPDAPPAEPCVQFVPNLLRHSLLFERCLREAAVLEGVRAVLGTDILLYLINGRRADLGGGNQPLHDLQRARGGPFRWCSTIWCLDAFTPANGATRFIPGSHMKAEPYLSRCKDPLEPHPDECSLVAPRGSVVIFNSHLIHGGSENRTNHPRRSVQSSFTLAGEKPHYDWRELPREIRAGLRPESLSLLGLE